MELEKKNVVLNNILKFVVLIDNFLTVGNNKK